MYIKILENHKLQTSASIFSFIFAFICLILMISQIYSIVNYEIPPNDVNRPAPPRDNFFRGMPKDSPFMLIVFIIGFLINSFIGTLLFYLSHKNEKKIIKSKIMDEMLLPEEKLVIKLLEENNGEMTQSILVKKSNLGKLKISRVIKKLESSNIIKKYPYGLTNNIKLEK